MGFEAARDTLTKALGPDGVAGLMLSAKAAYTRYGVGKQQRESLAELLALKARVDKAPDAMGPLWMETYYGLSVVYAESHDNDKAMEYAQALMERAVALWKRRKGVWRDRADAAEGLAQVLKREGADAKEIARLEEEAREERARVVKNGWSL